MSRIVTHSETFTGIPTSYDSTNSTVESVSNTQNGLNPHTNTTSNKYATLNGVRNSTVYAYYNFSGTTAIPLTASITSVSCIARGRVSSTSTNTGETYIQLCTNTTTKGSQTRINSTTASNYTTSGGSWTVSEISNTKLRISINRKNINTTYSVRFWGATLTVNYSWDEIFYEFTCNSSVQGVGITSGETTSGGSYTATITGISDISTVVIKDNGVDVTSTFTKSGNNYVKSYSNVSADHTITIEEAKTKGIYLKLANTFVESTNFYKRGTSAWSLIDYTEIYCKVNGSWITGHTMTGKTAMFFDRTYVLDNCVVNLDGIDSYNNRYEDTTSGFEGDIVYPIDHTSTFMRGFDIIADGKSFEFNGTTSYMRPGASASFDNYLYTGYTIEILFEPLSLPSTDGDAFTLFVGRNSKQTIAIYCYYYTGSFYFIKSSGVSSKLLVIPSISLNEKHYIAANADGWMFDGGYYPDSESTASTNSVGTNDILNVSGQYACASIGMRFKTDRDPDAFNGKLYALRIHSTKLTENEMRKNMSCDFSRFS